MNPNPTPEEMAAEFFPCTCDPLPERSITRDVHWLECPARYEKKAAEAIQSAQSQSQERIEELESAIQSVKTQCEYLADKPPNMQVLTIQTIYAGVCQALNPKKEGE